MPWPRGKKSLDARVEWCEGDVRLLQDKVSIKIEVTKIWDFIHQAQEVRAQLNDDMDRLKSKLDSTRCQISEA